MGLSEFSLIKRYFADGFYPRQDVRLGVGDDAAIVQPLPGQQLVMSLDTLVSGVHFPTGTAPEDIAYKSLAVNLSDMAAMGADPAWIMLGLTLPSVDESWLQAFSASLGRLAAEHRVALIGGDTTRGPLTVTVQITGFVPEGQALTRCGAQAGDLIYVTGQLGDAGLGLQLIQDRCPLKIEAVRRDYFIQRLERPTARINAGKVLRGLASAVIDVSDGLAADLGHILEQSGVGAVLNVENLPVSEEMHLLEKPWWRLPLSAGDDYELCFTLSPENEAEMLARMQTIECSVTCVGQISDDQGLRLFSDQGEIAFDMKGGYQHFE